jgi:pimeloyl-ACP methyl ester carboxylesterase
MDSNRRSILTTGAAVTAIAAAPRVFAQQTGQGGATVSFYERGTVRIYFEEAGSGFPLLLIPGGGLNSTISKFTGNSPFNPIEEFKGEYHCITADLRNANGGQSTGPLEVDRPWDAYADDQLGLMDHLRIDKFMVMGLCIGGPFIWNLLKRAPDRIVAAVLAQPSGSRPEMRDLFYEGNMKTWGPVLTAIASGFSSRRRCTASSTCSCSHRAMRLEGLARVQSYKSGEGPPHLVPGAAISLTRTRAPFRPVSLLLIARLPMHRDHQDAVLSGKSRLNDLIQRCILPGVAISHRMGGGCDGGLPQSRYPKSKLPVRRRP